MTKKSSPAISIILPAYNAMSFVEQSIKSVLNQSFEDFEFIIINDGSTDATPDILNRITDKRVRVVHQNNHGITFSLNRGLKLAHGNYIARMDADDIATPDRLVKQFDLLESNPEVGIIGSSANVIDDKDNDWGLQIVAQDDIEIRWVSLLKCPFIHPSVMFRKSILDQYQLDYGNLPYAQDYGLWVKILQYSKGKNFKEPLLSYRVHKTNVSKLHRETQFQIHQSISREQIHCELPDMIISDDEISQLVRLSLASSKEVSSMRNERISTILSFLNLWKEFSQKYQPVFAVDQIQPNVIGKALEWTFFPPIPERINPILEQVSKMDAFWYVHFLTKMLKSLPGFIRERAVWNK